MACHSILRGQSVLCQNPQAPSSRSPCNPDTNKVFRKCVSLPSTRPSASPLLWVSGLPSFHTSRSALFPIYLPHSRDICKPCGMLRAIQARWVELRLFHIAQEQIRNVLDMNTYPVGLSVGQHHLSAGTRPRSRRYTLYSRHVLHGCTDDAAYRMGRGCDR